MHLINLFKKGEQYYYVTVGTDGERINMPMYNSNFIIYKGIPNNIFFSVRNNDRKRVKLEDNQELKLVLINQPLQIEMVKKLEVVDANVGKYKITFTEDDMRKLEPATYLAHVAIYDTDASDDDSNEDEVNDVLFSSENWQPIFHIEVMPNKMEIYKESVEIGGFNPETYIDEHGLLKKKYVSSRIQSNVNKNHSFAMNLERFTGKVKIQGSLEMNPQVSEDDWFTLKEYEFNYQDESGEKEEIETILTSIESACQWVRIEYIINDNDYESDFVEGYYRN